MTRKMGKYEGGRRKPLDSSMEQFLNILKWVCWKRDVYFALVDPKGTSQTCPSCQTVTGKKGLDERVHECKTCGYQTDRDVAAAQVVMQRGCVAVGQTVVKLSEGKNSSFPMKKESPGFNKTSVARLV
jgi:putative transposase